MRRSVRVCARLLVLGLVAGAASQVPTSASADSAPPEPSDPRTPTTVTADALPTTQVDGVVWSQTVIGDTVYVAGSFTSARPAGVQRGTAETPRSNLLAYDLETGDLKAGFAPTTDAQVLSITRSPDGSRLYIGGQFTTVNGKSRSRIAALDTSGNLVTSFAPAAGTTVRAVVATADTVYAGGDFAKVGNGATTVARTYAAAFSAADGSVTSFDPAPNSSVNAMTLTPAKDAIVLGGRFTTLGGQPARGMGAVDVATLALRPWAANTTIQNGSANAAISALSSDDDSVYANGYVYGSGGNFEGSARIDPTTGSITWMEDCHGDTYGTAQRGGAVYVVGHVHSCSNVGGYPETNPRSWRYGLAFSKARTQTVQTNTQSGYANFAGQPAPTLQAFFPEFGIGTFTGQSQATWTVTTAGKYMLFAGEFPGVNGKIQQGLARFTDRESAPNKVGPKASSGLTPSVTSPATGVAQVQWSTTSDPDNAELTYRVYRDGSLVHTVRQTSVDWRPSALRFVDQRLQAGRSYSYTVTATDPTGNQVTGSAASVTAAATGTSSTLDSYSAAVLASGPTSYWRLGESSGTTATDLSGNNRNATYQGSYALNQAGAVAASGSSSRAVTLNRPGFGTAGSVAANATTYNPGSFSTELWFRTTSTSGGRLIGLSSAKSGTSASTDRSLWMLDSGRLRVGVAPGGNRTTVDSGSAYNDGAWHHAVVTQSTAGLVLYVDGQAVASDPGATRGQDFAGYWRVGADATWSGATSSGFAGQVDEVAVYQRALAAAEVGAHRLAGLGQTPNVAPTAGFTATATLLAASFDASSSTDSDGDVRGYAWDFGDGTTGTGRTVDHTYARAGTYTVRLTVTDDDGATGTTSRELTVAAAPARPVIAEDAFGRTATSGWGTADKGGDWTVAGGKTNFSVGGGAARAAAPAGGSLRATLAGVSATSSDTTVDLAVDKAVTDGSLSLGLYARGTSTDGYRTHVGVTSGGAVTAYVQRLVAGSGTTLASARVPGVSLVPGTALRLRTQVVGTSPTTVRFKVWAVGTEEPADWTVQTTDDTAALQQPGGVGLWTFVSSAVTTGPVTAAWDDLKVTEPAA